MSVISFLGYDDGAAGPGLPHTTVHHAAPSKIWAWLASERLVSTTLAHWFLRVTLQVFRPLCTYTCISP